MWLKWLPWRLIVRNFARQQGFLDPLSILAKFQNFAQPSDVLAPRELMREGLVLHARGLMNSQAIQHNLDWVWPYWAEQQFDPNNKSFIPRAFSLTQINLTHRNWTAVGVPAIGEFPIVDPRGLLTVHYDGWSLDAWIITDGPKNLIPSRLPQVSQKLLYKGNLGVLTQSSSAGLSLDSTVQVIRAGGKNFCHLALKGLSRISQVKSWLVISLRPYNPEGVSFVHHVELCDGKMGWKINHRDQMMFSEPAQQYEFSYYRHGDVFHRLPSIEDKSEVYCKVGMATAAALFELKIDQEREVSVNIPLQEIKAPDHVVPFPDSASYWDHSLRGHAQLDIPDGHFKALYDAALRTVILHSADDVYPGPYTYRRFWFRDAAFILYAMLSAGLIEQVQRVIQHFPSRQLPNGYFYSQDGEWDSNGEALWIMRKFCEMTGRPLDAKCLATVNRGGKWIVGKRSKNLQNVAHAGLFPAGFSAEHLGPNDYYYWDDFWGVAGLEAASYLENLDGQQERAKYFALQAQDFMEAINRSLMQVQRRLNTDAMPAAPYRRLDSGAIGSLAAGYPLKIFKPHDRRLTQTVQYLLDHCFVDGGFFHDMTHSGINPYLTLHIAQVLLRSGEVRYFDLMKSIARLSSATGQWPEAIHPITKGGCMGDGQHVWAAAEWILMIRNCFIREEEQSSKIVLCSGIPDEWTESMQVMSFGPTLTTFGPMTVWINPAVDTATVSWEGQWGNIVPTIEIALPGFPKITMKPHDKMVTLHRKDQQCVS